MTPGDHVSWDIAKELTIKALELKTPATGSGTLPNNPTDLGKMVAEIFNAIYSNLELKDKN